jgi:type II secretory pathway component GspD/PulD (secretin)
MCARACAVFVAALFPAAAQQVAERVFSFIPAHTVQSLLELVTVIRTVTGIRQISLDDERKSVTVRGTADEVRLVEWLVPALDRPATVPQEYSGPGAADDGFRVFHLTYAQTVRDLQEMATLLRAVADARHVYPYTPATAVVFRGNAWRISLAEWLISELNQPANTPSPAGPRDYRMLWGSDIVPPTDVFVRIFYTRARTPEELSSVLTGMRSAVKMIPRSSFITARGAIIVRGSAENISAAEQALQRLGAHGLNQ